MYVAAKTGACCFLAARMGSFILNEDQSLVRSTSYFVCEGLDIVLVGGAFLYLNAIYALLL